MVGQIRRTEHNAQFEMRVKSKVERVDTPGRLQDILAWCKWFAKDGKDTYYHRDLFWAVA